MPRTASRTVPIPPAAPAPAPPGPPSGPRARGGALCCGGFPPARLTATTTAPASAAIRATVVPMPPPPAPDTTTMRPSSLRRSVTRLFVRTIYGALHIEEHYSAAVIGSSRPRRVFSGLLSGLFELDNVRGHDHVAHRRPLLRAHPEGCRRLVVRTADTTQPAVRRERLAHRT